MPLWSLLLNVDKQRERYRTRDGHLWSGTNVDWERVPGPAHGGTSSVPEVSLRRVAIVWIENTATKLGRRGSKRHSIIAVTCRCGDFLALANNLPECHVAIAYRTQRPTFAVGDHVANSRLEWLEYGLCLLVQLWETSILKGFCRDRVRRTAEWWDFSFEAPVSEPLDSQRCRFTGVHVHWCLRDAQCFTRSARSSQRGALLRINGPRILGRVGADRAGHDTKARGPQACVTHQVMTS